MLRELKSDFSFEDERGKIVQLVHEGYKQFNVIYTKKGVVRGGHYHKKNNEAFYIISGMLRVDIGDVSKEFHSGDFFSIDAYDMHSFYFLEDTILVSMYSNGVELDNGEKDIFTNY